MVTNLEVTAHVGNQHLIATRKVTARSSIFIGNLHGIACSPTLGIEFTAGHGSIGTAGGGNGISLEDVGTLRKFADDLVDMALGDAGVLGPVLGEIVQAIL